MVEHKENVIYFLVGLSLKYQHMFKTAFLQKMSII